MISFCPHPLRKLAVAVLAALAATGAMAARAGALDVPLSLRDVAGVERVQDPCSTGVPLPQGLLTEPEGIAVFDPEGRAVPAQFRVLERWRDHGGDGSVKWLLVTFLADVPAAGEAVYRLRSGINPVPDQPATATGGLGPFQLMLTDADGRPFTDADVRGIDVEVVEAGPVRACVRIESPSSHDTFGFIAWVYTYAGLARTDLTVVLKNTPNERVGPFYFRDFSVSVPVAGGEYLLGGEPGSTLSGPLGPEPVVLYQASCGTDRWEEFGGNDFRDALVMDWSEDKAVAKAGVCAFRGWRAMRGETRLDEGRYALGWGGLREGERTGILLTRHFRENHPSAVEVQPGRLLSRLLPKYYTGYGGLHWLDDATRKRFDLSFQTHEVLSPERADGLAEAFNKPLVAHAGLEWLRGTGVFGNKLADAAVADVQVKDWPHDYGGGSQFPLHANWVTFGGTTIDRIRRRYHQHTMDGFMRGGDPWEAYALMIRTNHTAGLTPLWLDDYRHPRDQLNVSHYLGLARDAGDYREGTQHRGWRTWNMAHFDCQELFDAWRLFGDPLAMKAVRDVGSYSQNYVEYRRQGGHLGQTRNDGHPMYNLAEAYRVTGREDFLESLKIMAGVAWNQVDKQRGNYGVNQGGGTTGATGPHEKPMMMCQVIGGLIEYWKLTHDARTADQILGMLDFIVTEGSLGELGFAYLVEFDPDLQAAYRRETIERLRGSGHTSYGHLAPFIAWGHWYSGEPRFREAIDGITTELHPHQSRAYVNYHPERPPGDPPPPIDDLEAEALGGGRVRLTWTTPAGADVVRIKHADRPMVERAWPDRIATHVNWWAAEHVEGVPAPDDAGARAEMIVEGLEPGRRVFSARAFNSRRQRSGLGAMAAVEVR